MRRCLEVGTVPALLEVLQKEGVRTKVQVRTSGPHRGGIAFRRGSLFHLLKNPVYRGKIIHKGSVYDGEHEPIIDEALWQAVQEQLARKAPPRKTRNNEGQNALLQGLLWDAHARPMVPTYNSKGSRRYSYYETRKDLARPADPSATRYQRAMLETHILQHLAELLEDDHALRRLTLVDQAGQLASVFAAARGLAADLQDRLKAPRAIKSLVERIVVSSNDISVSLRAEALGLDPGDEPTATLPLPTRKPFREVKLRIDAVAHAPNEALIKLLADAHQVQRLVLASPELSLNALGKREGRCRTQLGRLLRLSWISPRIVEAIVAGSQPEGLTRAALLRDTLPLSWAEQERLLGLSD